ncbi:MAG: GNAT family N-acetyltransferase [Peptoanaerobacter stomatis]
MTTKAILSVPKVLKEKYKKLVLFVNENNKNAITLYTKLGFISEQL